MSFSITGNKTKVVFYCKTFQGNDFLNALAGDFIVWVLKSSTTEDPSFVSFYLYLN